jgi:hypothetical protein
MPTTVTINDVTGSTPVYVYFCDDNPLSNPASTCVYLGSTSTFPNDFDIPEPFDTQPDYYIKIVDSNGCINVNYLTV